MRGARRSTPLPFHYSYHHVQSCSVRFSRVGQIHSPYFISTNICTLWFRTCGYKSRICQSFQGTGISNRITTCCSLMPAPHPPDGGVEPAVRTQNTLLKEQSQHLALFCDVLVLVSPLLLGMGITVSRLKAPEQATE